MKKIMIDARFVEDRMTGIGRYTYNIIDNLLSIDKNTQYFVIINDKLDAKHPIFKMNFRNMVLIKCTIPTMGIQQQIRIPLLLKKINPDLYFYPHFDAPLIHNTPLLITIYDLKYILFDNFFKKWSIIKRLYIKISMSLSLKKAKNIITISQSTRKDILRVFKTNPEKIKVIYLAASKEFHKINSKDLIRKRIKKYPIKNKYFLCVGESRPHKNLINAIKAFEIFLRHKKEFQLVIVGKSDKRFTMHIDYIRKHNLERNIIITDSIGDNDLNQLYNGAIGYVFVSLYEGFGIPLIEAMQCGTPVITSDISSLPEVGGDAVLYVNPKDPSDIANGFKKIVNNSSLRKGLIQKGMIQAKKFSWEKAANETLKLLMQAIKE